MRIPLDRSEAFAGDHPKILYMIMYIDVSPSDYYWKVILDKQSHPLTPTGPADTMLEHDRHVGRTSGTVTRAMRSVALVVPFLGVVGDDLVVPVEDPALAVRAGFHRGSAIGGQTSRPT
jgi:hypothetical protein